VHAAASTPYNLEKPFKKLCIFSSFTMTHDIKARTRQVSLSLYALRVLVDTDLPVSQIVLISIDSAASTSAMVRRSVVLWAKLRSGSRPDFFESGRGVSLGAGE
jgi:hypothetical protein